MSSLMGIKNTLVINDEAHQCYREKPGGSEETDLTGEEKDEVEQNREAARLWNLRHRDGQPHSRIQRVINTSATPFFPPGLRLSRGHALPLDDSDFSLMDAIESGFVRLPRVPVSDNIPGNEVPIFRNLWENFRTLMPKKGRGKAEGLDPQNLPTPLCTALDTLHGLSGASSGQGHNRSVPYD